MSIGKGFLSKITVEHDEGLIRLKLGPVQRPQESMLAISLICHNVNNLIFLDLVQGGERTITIESKCRFQIFIQVKTSQHCYHWLILYNCCDTYTVCSVICFREHPKPFLLDCPLPENHPKNTPASVSLVKTKFSSIFLQQLATICFFLQILKIGSWILPKSYHQLEGGLQQVGGEWDQKRFCGLCQRSVLPQGRSLNEVWNISPPMILLWMKPQQNF